MAKKKTGGADAQAVKAAWQKVRDALTQTETAVRNLLAANRELMHALRTAGASPANARKQFDALAKRIAALTSGKKNKSAAKKKKR